MPAKPKPKRKLGWHHKTLKIASLWDQGIEGNQTRIALIDSGLASVNGLNRDTFEYLDPDGADIGPGDVAGHGTQAASVVASNHKDALGIAPKARITSYRCIEGGDQEGKVESALTAIASRDDIDVVLCAFTLPSIQDPITVLVRELVMRGVVVVAAAGNDIKLATGFPEDATYAVTTAAVDEDLAALPDAQVGDWIDLAAPGDNIPSLLADPGKIGPFGRSSGASAVVAGVAALALGTRTGTRRRKLGKALDGLLRSSARPIDADPRAVGAGVLDPTSLLALVNKGF